MDISSLLLGLVLTLVLYLWYRRDDPRLPPCPVTPLPIIGHMHYMKKNHRPQFKQWRKMCGDIFTLYLGQSRVVVFNGYDLLKEVFVKKTTVTSDRPYYFYDAATGRSGLGITFASGAMFKEHREVTISIFKSLGMGKNILASKIQEIVADYVDFLSSLQGKPTDIIPHTGLAVSNVICSIVIGHRFQHDDESFLRVIEDLRLNIEEGGSRNLVNYFPFLRHVPGNLFAAKGMRARAEYVMDVFVRKFVEQIKSDGSTEHEPDNYVAAYLQEMRKKQQAGKSTVMDDLNLKKMVFDLYGAGMETMSGTITWAVIFMLHYPDTQEKAYEEIKKVVGTGRPVSMQDKPNLPYLNAFIFETLRLASIVPLSIMHTNTEDITVRGYTIPAGTNLIPNIDSVLFEKEIWGQDANSFRPERFLDENGKVRKREELIPFFVGNRLCPGEALAMMELLLFLGAMIQRFRFLPENPGELPSYDIILGITAPPVPYKVRVVDRFTS